MEVKKLDDTESVQFFNDIIMMKNGMYRFIINNQLLINCYKNDTCTDLLLLTLKYLYITCIYSYYFPIFLYSGGYVRRGFYSGGYVRRGFCPQGVMS